MVSVESVVTTRRPRHERVSAGAPSGWTQITSIPGAKAFTTRPTPVFRVGRLDGRQRGAAVPHADLDGTLDDLQP
ncbi:hypothetical protein QFZ76_003338 [Streptomyces sp. V4I2]|nr:hypothetical protein [Streptomyces sp. V4I2]